MRAFDRARPFVNVVLQKIGLLGTLESRAIERRVLQPAQTETVPPAIFLPGQLERATKVIEGGDLAQSRAYLAGTVVTHSEVVEYIIRDAFVHPGGVDLWGSRLYASRPRLLDAMPLWYPEIERAAYCMDAVSRERFGHWLTDACPTSLLAQDGQLPIIDVKSDWPHAMAYGAAFNIEPAQGPFRVQYLSVFEDLAQGSSKRARYRQLRSRLAAALPTRGGANCIYLRRGETGDRRVLNNEDAVMHLLDRRGFRTVDVHNLELAEIHAELRNASIIVSLDGSHITHIYYLAPEKATLVTLIPDDRFVDVHKNYCDCIGMKYGFLVCRRAEDGYDVDLDDLERTLDLIPA